MPISREKLIQEFQLFSTGNPGVESLVLEKSPPVVLDRLCSLSEEPLSKVQFNQLLLLALEAGLSDGFFQYYWLESPSRHPYNVDAIPGFDGSFRTTTKIETLSQLKWGLYRVYVDGLLFRGGVRRFYREFCNKTHGELVDFFAKQRTNTAAVKKRGPTMPFAKISKDNRYLISEMACKSYGDLPGSESELRKALSEALRDHLSRTGGAVKVRDLLDGTYVKQKYPQTKEMWLFSADDMLDQEVKNEADLEARYSIVAREFQNARNAALENTRLYLSMVNDLDVYVATSMRTRADFRKMAEDCDAIFSDDKLLGLHLRYFDPTLSAAEGHQDKGLIECLMVKCAKVLVYCAGLKESYGKDAEAAMALSLGKPVIFYCDEEQKRRFFRDVHPLSRLINFENGVAVGAMVADKIGTVIDLLNRTFENTMEYALEQPKPGYLQLVERLTGSVVRLQTNNKLLTEAFWNYYKTASLS